MRTTVAVLLAITILFVGFTAVSESAQQTEQIALNNSGGDAWNLSTDVYGGIGEAGSSALVYGGIGAIVLVSLGVLVAAGNSGGR